MAELEGTASGLVEVFESCHLSLPLFGSVARRLLPSHFERMARSSPRHFLIAGLGNYTHPDTKHRYIIVTPAVSNPAH